MFGSSDYFIHLKLSCTIVFFFSRNANKGNKATFYATIVQLMREMKAAEQGLHSGKKIFITM